MDNKPRRFVYKDEPDLIRDYEKVSRRMQNGCLKLFLIAGLASLVLVSSCTYLCTRQYEELNQKQEYGEILPQTPLNPH